MAASSEISIMTFNLRYDNPKDGQNAWSAGRNKLAADLIRKHRPSVLAIQEGLIHQLTFLESHLEGVISHHIGCGRKGGDKDEHCALFYDPNVINVEESGNFWLSKTPEEAGSYSWFSFAPRMCTWASFHLKSNPAAKFAVFNTHLDHVSILARAKGAKVISQFMKKLPACQGMAQFITGDMNTTKTREHIYKMWLHKDFKDGWCEAPEKDDGGCKAGTHHAFHPTLDPTSHTVNDGKEFIDWILYRAIKAKYSVTVTRADIFTDHTGTSYPSDHFPVSVNFKLESTSCVEQ